MVWRDSVREQLRDVLGSDNRKWLVGVSGGGDSLALLRALGEEGWGERLKLAYFNHGWSEWGDTAEAFVRAFADHLNVPLLVGKGSGKAGSNAEARARTERYDWFKSVCAEHDLAGVMVGHTRTDVVEGFLMRAGKGSGLKGLSGMSADVNIEGLRVFRPLLEVGRDDLRAYLRSLKQEWLEDPDNEMGGSQRARLRKILPILDGVGVNEQGLAASVAALARADALVEEHVDSFMQKEVSLLPLKVALPREALVKAPDEVALRVVERVIGHFSPGMAPRSSKRSSLLQRLRDTESGAATLGGVKFAWRESAIMAEQERGSEVAR